jgi:hypothetical protein
MLSTIPKEIQSSISQFFKVYIETTQKSTITVRTFIENIIRAYQAKKFGLQCIEKYTLYQI